MGLLLKEDIKIQRVGAINQFGDTLYEEPFVIDGVEIERFPLFLVDNGQRVRSQRAKVTIFSSKDYSKKNLLHARVTDEDCRTYFISDICPQKNDDDKIIKTEIILEEEGGNDN